MKKYRTDKKDISTAELKSFERLKIIVWLGSSEFWEYVYLNKEDNRLYVRVKDGRVYRFEALDSFNIRKIEPF